MTALTAAGLDGDAVAAVDSTAQASAILGLGGQLRDALDRVGSARLRRLPAPGGVLVAGMGGSATGGRLAAAALGDRLRRPLVSADGYDLPPWVGEGMVVLCSSYSGGTEETLSCYEQARRPGEFGELSAVSLEDPDDRPEIGRRVALTAELAGAGARAIERVSGVGSGRLERLLSLVLLGDLVSLYLAVLRQVDPVEIEAISTLKAALNAGG